MGCGSSTVGAVSGPKEAPGGAGEKLQHISTSAPPDSRQAEKRQPSAPAEDGIRSSVPPLKEGCFHVYLTRGAVRAPRQLTAVRAARESDRSLSWSTGWCLFTQSGATPKAREAATTSLSRGLPRRSGGEASPPGSARTARCASLLSCYYHATVRSPVRRGMCQRELSDRANLITH